MKTCQTRGSTECRCQAMQ